LGARENGGSDGKGAACNDLQGERRGGMVGVGGEGFRKENLAEGGPAQQFYTIALEERKTRGGKRM